MQYEGKRIAVYVDNELWAETLYEGDIVPCKTTDIGIARRLVDQPFAFKGIIDEIVVSSKLRY